MTNQMHLRGRLLWLIFPAFLLVLGTRVQALQTVTVNCQGGDDTARFAAALSTARSSNSVIKLPRNRRCALNSLTIPANVTLDNSEGAGLTINDGQTLNISGAVINSPTKQLFNGEGTVSFGANRIIREVYADWWGGSDLGAAVNAADAAVGSGNATIACARGGRIATPIQLSANHKLHLAAGTYSATTSGAPFVLQSGTTLDGDGSQTILQETTGDDSTLGFLVIATPGNGAAGGLVTRNITIRNLQIQGTRSGFHQAAAAIAVGNLHGGLIENVYFNRTNAIGIDVGGDAALSKDPLGLGQFAESVIVQNCSFEGVAAVNLAVVNGKNITLRNNRFLNPGKAGGPSGGAIDLEVNTGNDYLENILVTGNTLDARNSQMGPFGSFISVSAGSHNSNIVITGNVGQGGFRTSNGVIAANLTRATISNNTFEQMQQCGIYLEGGSYVTVTRNTLTNTGTGGIESIRVSNTSNSQFTGNILQSPILGADNIIESGLSNNNQYITNRVPGGIKLAGRSSRIAG